MEQPQASSMPAASNAVAPASVLVLADYYNLRPKGNVERTSADVHLNLMAVMEDLARTLSQLLPAAQEMEVWLYGGWTTELGQYSPAGWWVLQALPLMKGHRAGLRVIPRMVTAAACRPADELKGLYRVNVRVPRQKMVDELMTVDALHSCTEPGRVLALASDDDDMVPAVVAASSQASHPVLLLRKRSAGKGANDGLLMKCGVRVCTIVGAY